MKFPFKVGDYALHKTDGGILNGKNAIEDGWVVVRFTMVGDETDPFMCYEYSFLNSMVGIYDSSDESDIGSLHEELKPISKKDAIALLFGD